MDIIQLYQDYGIDYVTEGHKHARPGWVNTACPFCTGNPGYHLGYNIQDNFFFCWRCGWHSIPQSVSRLLNISEQDAKPLIQKYGLSIPHATKESKVEIRIKAFQYPSDTARMTEAHKQYLESRLYDSTHLEQTWQLAGTGPVGLLDGISYARRIIIPVTWDRCPVSFTSRDITGVHLMRYLSCPKDREVIHHKDILYGRQDKWLDIGICVEGPADVWRLGPTAFATFGIKYTMKQVRIMAKHFKQIIVFYDSDPQAILQADKLVADLKFRGVVAERLTIPGDPGSMKQEDADYFVKHLMK